MAKPNKLGLVTTVIFCLICCKSSAARPLNDVNTSSLAATGPAFNIVAPVKERIGGASPALQSEELASEDFHARPREMELMKTQGQGTGNLGGIYGSLVMNVLPKGRTPASGPSRRNNDIST